MKRHRLDSIAMTIGLTIVIAMGLGLTLQQLANAGLGLIGFPQWKNPLYFETRFLYHPSSCQGGLGKNWQILPARHPGVDDV
jgi:hypothetical protein